MGFTSLSCEPLNLTFAHSAPMTKLHNDLTNIYIYIYIRYRVQIDKSILKSITINPIINYLTNLVYN